MKSKIILIIIISFSFIYVTGYAQQGDNWYVDNQASGANNGTSWRDAWSETIKTTMDTNKMVTASYILSQAEDGIYYVDQSNPNASDSNTGTESSPFFTIQHAADIARPNDIVIVKAGDYEEFVLTQRDGESDSYITFKAADGEDVYIEGILLAHNYYKIQGFKIRRDGMDGLSDGYGAIELRPEISFIEISNNLITANGGSGVAVFCRSTEYSRNHIIIKNNIFGPSENASSHCIRFRGRDNLIENNIFNYWGGNDAIAYLSRNSVIKNNVFNSVSHKSGSGIHPDCIQVYTEENVNCNNTIIEGNVFKNCSGQVIYVSERAEGQTVENWTIRNNLIVNCGAVSTSCPTPRVHNNTYYLSSVNGGHPISVWFEGTEVKNNLIIGCSIDPSNSSYGFYNIRNTLVGFIRDYYDNFDYNYVAGAYPNYESKNTNPENWSPFLEEHGINGGDPMFVNANIGWIWGDDNGSDYSGSANSFEVNEVEISRFVVGEFIEYSPFNRGVDGIARQITDVDTENNLIAFVPDIDDYAAPTSGISKANYPDGDICNFYILLWGDKDWLAGDTITPDFSLQANSPAINAGASLLENTSDLNGITRPYGAGWDIGAYEYTGIDAVDKLHLYQNHPNPFIVETIFKYDLSENLYIEISLFDIAGRKVRTLFSGVQSEGPHEEIVNGTSLSSGVYFFRIQGNNFKGTKKCLLIK